MNYKRSGPPKTWLRDHVKDAKLVGTSGIESLASIPEESVSIHMLVNEMATEPW